MKAGEVQSHAVYPLASNVALKPPDGKEEASGSPLISSLPDVYKRQIPYNHRPAHDSIRKQDMGEVPDCLCIPVLLKDMSY